jgi:endonuclease YncB( thermonuclease family)
MLQIPRLCLVSLALVLFLSAAGPARSDDLGQRSSFEARVVRVVDGDTIVVAHSGRREKIRLAQIDAPESNQPHGDAATRALSALVLQREVRIVPVASDRYGRLVAEVYQGDTHVNPTLVQQGHSWVYHRYAVDASLNEQERNARDARRGLWALPESERRPPWDWRAARRAGKSRAASKPAADLPAECATRRYCRDMRSCDEAMFFLQVCGFRSLDGDGDGVPCESICNGSR